MKLAIQRLLSAGDIPEAEASMAGPDLSSLVDCAKQRPCMGGVAERVELGTQAGDRELVELVRSAGELDLAHGERKVVVEWRFLNQLDTGESLGLGREPALRREPLGESLVVQELRHPT
jgi:hypothetical protein